MRLHFQASFFADLASIEPTPEITLKIFQALTSQNIGVMPSTIGELTPGAPAPVPRLRFVSPDSNFEIIIGRGRLDIIKRAQDPDQSSLGSAVVFSEEAGRCVNAILADCKISANRLAFIASTIWPDSDLETLDRSYDRLFNPPRYFVEHRPTEWTFRSNARNPLSVSNVDEACNIILKVERTQGIISTMGNQKQFDRILTEIDINTIQESLNPRFDKEVLKEFVINAGALEDRICADLRQQLIG